MWNCMKFQCFKMCFSVQLDQSKFGYTEISIHFHISYISKCPQEIVLQNKPSILLLFWEVLIHAVYILRMNIT